MATGYVKGWDLTDAAQILDLSTTTQTCTIKNYPDPVKGATGAVISNSPVICQGTVCKKYDKDWKFLTSINDGLNECCTGGCYCGMSSASSLVSNNTRLFITGGYGPDWCSLNDTIYVDADGTVEAGPPMPEARNSHCQVTLSTQEIIIIGGSRSNNALDRNSEFEKSVITFNMDNNKYNTMPSTKYERIKAACALIKNSPMHDNRPVVLVVGGSHLYAGTAEVFDYTQPNAEWQESKHISIIYLYRFLRLR